MHLSSDRLPLCGSGNQKKLWGGWTAQRRPPPARGGSLTSVRKRRVTCRHAHGKRPGCHCVSHEGADPVVGCRQRQAVVIAVGRFSAPRCCRGRRHPRLPRDQGKAHLRRARPYAGHTARPATTGQPTRPVDRAVRRTCVPERRSIAPTRPGKSSPSSPALTGHGSACRARPTTRPIRQEDIHHLVDCGGRIISAPGSHQKSGCAAHR